MTVTEAGLLSCEVHTESEIADDVMLSCLGLGHRVSLLFLINKTVPLSTLKATFTLI